ncbi:serine/threonine-protein kinase SIK1 [Camelus ferus]|nr:serine/threonine-protein kinase SIK1 [Camelus ferus]
MVIMSELSAAPAGSGHGQHKPLRVGFYDIERTLGKGNFAVVKLARHRVTKTQLGFRVWGLQLRFVPSDYLTSNGHLSESEARKKFWQVLSAVEHCHSLHIVHRDLKTENLLLDGNMDVKLADCETLIRRMLVVDPAKRITIAQIRQHRWMQAEPSLLQQTCLAFSLLSYSSSLGDYDEQALGIMQTLGVDRQRTVESLQNSSYNHFAAIYYLLLERLKEYRLAPPTRSGPARQHRPRSTDLSGFEVPQDGFPGDAFRSSLLCPQPQALGQSVLQAEMDCDLHSSLQPLLFPTDANCNGVFRHRSVSPSSLLDTTISEEVRQGQGLEEEQEAQKPPPSSTGRRHTLAEVSACFSPCAPPCIVVSPSAASPSEGTSSDSCLSSAGDSPAGLSGHLAAQGLVGTCSPLRLASPLLGAQSATPVLQAQGVLGGAALLPVSFQEGRRASDTSLTQGLKAFRQQLRKNGRTKGFLGLNKIKGLARQVCLPSSSSRACRGGLFPLPAQSPGLQGSGASGREGRRLLEEGLHQQRLLQLQHHTVALPSCPQAPQPPPSPLVLAPRDGGLLVSGLQKELGLGPGPLLPPHLLQAGVSPDRYHFLLKYLMEFTGAPGGVGSSRAASKGLAGGAARLGGQGVCPPLLPPQFTLGETRAEVRGRDERGDSSVMRGPDDSRVMA